jgi:hypothetical protein
MIMIMINPMTPPRTRTIVGDHHTCWLAGWLQVPAPRWVNEYFAVGTLHGDEPRRAVVLTYVVSGTAVFIGPIAVRASTLSRPAASLPLALCRWVRNPTLTSTRRRRRRLGVRRKSRPSSPTSFS